MWWRKTVETELKTFSYGKGNQDFPDQTQISGFFTMNSGFWALFYFALEKYKCNEISMIPEENVESCQVWLGKRNCNMSSEVELHFGEGAR